MPGTPADGTARPPVGREAPPRRGGVELAGQGAAEGIAIGRAAVFAADEPAVPRRRIAPSDAEPELARFRRALVETRAELAAAHEMVAERLGDDHRLILDAQKLVLDDPMLARHTEEGVRRGRQNVEAALSDALSRLADSFSALNDEYLRERSGDVADVGRRILRRLLGHGPRPLPRVTAGCIVVARTLDPSETAMLSRDGACALVLERSGRTSHTAILARALGLPTVVGVPDATSAIRNGDEVVVDGEAGRVAVRPEPAVREHYRREHRRQQERQRVLARLKHRAAETQDGHRIEIAANLELPEELPSVLACGAEGIGLYRTEFLFLGRAQLPDEEEQFEAYRKIARGVAPSPVIIRTVDLGGDKLPLGENRPREGNPFLGVRAIRLCLERPELFRPQLRAILRASAHGKVKILFPMVSGIAELRRANEAVTDVKAELRREGVAFDKEIETGAMVEVPSAALTADQLAREADFLSIGTNDLIQYALAADRTNERLNHLLDPLHPAVLRLLRAAIDGGHREGGWVGLCGEMASEPLYTLLLLGLGVDELSMVPSAVPSVKQIVRDCRMADARTLAEKVLSLSSAEEAREELRSALSSLRGIRVRR